MRKYVIKRVFQIILTLFIYMTIVFIILQAQPGDISQVYLNDPKIPPEAREALRERLGLDEPLHIQYINYLRNFLTGNLGVSFFYYPRPVWEIIMERLPRTVVLFLTAYIIYFALGYQLGKWIAWRRGTLLDYGATVSGVFLWTVYTPWFALLLIWIFAIQLGWLPSGKFLDPLKWRLYDIPANLVFGKMILVGGGAFLFMLGTYLLGRRLKWPPPRQFLINLGAAAVSGVGIWSASQNLIGYLALDILHHMILPVLTLTFIGFGGYMLLMRDSMLDVVKEDYVQAAKAKGLPDKAVRDRHAARNAMLPIVTSFILAIAFTVDGSIVIETIFSWPGIGLTLLEAALQEDVPLAVGTFVFTGIFVLIAHLVADILYAYLDPRIRYD